jgi:hypothetical protein
MPRVKVTESQIKAALSARDKSVRADADARRALLTRVRAGRRQGEKVLVSYLRKTGFDFDACETVRLHQVTQLQRALKEAQTAAVKRSSARNKELKYAVEGWRKTIERFRDGTVTSGFVPAFEVIETPFLIWPTTELELEDSHIEPWNNTAKIRAHLSDSGEENLRFIFVWENPVDRWTVVNVESNLAANGRCDAFAVGGFLIGSQNGVFVRAALNVWEWWNQPPTMLAPQATQTPRVLAVTASGGGPFSNLGGGEVDSASVNGIFYRRRTLVSVPPRGVVVFEVAIEFFYDNSGGGFIQVEFASGSFGLKCPAVVIAVLS